MQILFYHFMKYLMKYLTYFYYSKVEVVGRDKVPRNKPVIFSCNHQNAFMDALILGGFSPIRYTSSLTRSDVFNPKFKWFLDGVMMMPIYRMRDGYDQLAKNEAVFADVRRRLADNQGISIFSEGNHANDYFLRNLSKGSSRMALESLEKFPNMDLKIVPAGLNYYHHQRPMHKLSLVYGEPISVQDYFEEYQNHKAKGINKLKAAVTEGMKECLMLPENSEDYETVRSGINRRNERLPFKAMRRGLKEGGLAPAKAQNKLIYYLGVLLGIFNFLPLLILQKILKPIKDIVFYGSLKWSAAFILFPLWFLIVFAILTAVFTAKIGGMVALGCIIALYLRQYLIKWSNVSH